MPFNWSVENVTDYTEISCATYSTFQGDYPVFKVTDSEDVKFKPIEESDNRQFAPLPDTDNEQELALYLSRINAWIEHNVTQNIVWTTMQVGLNTVTEDNVDEWVRRLDLLKDSGTRVTLFDLQFDEVGLMFTTQVQREITREDLVRRVGLWTNASRMNKREFNARAKEMKEKLAS